MEGFPEFCEEKQQVLSVDKQEHETSVSLTLGHPIKSISDVNEIPKTEPALEGRVPFQAEERLRLGFNSQPKPWFPPSLLQKLDKMRKGVLKSEELVDLIEKIAEICTDFYQVESGRVIAVKFDGRIVESEDTEIDLLLKVQGRKLDMPIFVWQVGSESFSGWRT
jgi:hypothetical protein